MIDALMESFVAWHGEVPPDAKRIDDAAATEHAAPWVRRNIGQGVAHGYIIGYEKGACWWTQFFERTSVYQPYPEGAERWHIEAYDHKGKSWIGNYYFWPAENRWRHVFFATAGEDYGRAPSRAANPASGPSGGVLANKEPFGGYRKGPRK